MRMVRVRGIAKSTLNFRAREMKTNLPVAGWGNLKALCNSGRMKTDYSHYTITAWVLSKSLSQQFSISTTQCHLSATYCTNRPRRHPQHFVTKDTFWDAKVVYFLIVVTVFVSLHHLTFFLANCTFLPSPWTLNFVFISLLDFTVNFWINQTAQPPTPLHASAGKSPNMHTTNRTRIMKGRPAQTQDDR